MKCSYNEKMQNENRQKALAEIMAALGPMYTDRKPFLNFENPFQLLIATVLSAQCMDTTVNTVTPGLFRRFPDPKALMDASLAEVEKIVKSVTFSRAKAHNIKALSRMIMERHGGEVPKTMEELTSMPGVGRKTAGTVLSVCFGQPAIIVDTHFSRVSRRLGLTASEKPEEIERNIAAISKREEWTDVSAVLNRFGRAVCHARKPECEICPVTKYCLGA
jgi:endonuclease-3